MLYSAVKYMGMAAHALDIEFSRKLDITNAFGFLATLYNVPGQVWLLARCFL